ncbi:MAG: acyl-CoA dehydrogenase [Thiotrichales bacterium]
MNAWFGLLVGAGLLVGIARTTWPAWVWFVLAGFGLAAGALLGIFGIVSALVVGAMLVALAAVALVAPLRRRALSQPVLAWVKHNLPPLSATERTAIEAGTVGWDAELFRGQPDFEKLLALPRPRLSPEERAFLDGPVEELCRRIDDWHITHDLNRLPDELWTLIKREGFLGMIIPKAHGGLGFSALGHSQVVMKLASRSVSVAVSVMVPNSLGPAELLLHYGTPAQKSYYLPRLARGEEIPCFALTGPEAGSDASAIPDFGIVCRGLHEGREVLGLRLTWDKRYITLGPIATLLGLAFRAHDPEHLLGDDEDLGITCALIPTSTPGIEIGERHYPLNAAFMNGPNRGRDVFIPLDWVIGGAAGVGDGWRMLMESLAAGRGISLPALSVAGAKHCSLSTGAYARVRKQFRLPIGKFEGVEEVLARIGGLTYMMDAARTLTTTALDQGEKPAVVSAILKYQLTEMMRQVVNDAMDVHGGRGICMGPSNYLARTYQSLPISITVEGANILARSMIIFGQGAIRCHPYLIHEIEAAHEADPARAVTNFDATLIRHVGYAVRNAARALVYGLSGARLAPAPAAVALPQYYRQLGRYASAFALTADAALLTFGGNLKRREKISGRFADALGFLYLTSAVLKRHEDQGRPVADRAFVDWAMEYGNYRIQEALDGVIRHFPIAPARWLLRALVFPLGRWQHPPRDELGRAIAAVLMEPGEDRDRLCDGIFRTDDPGDITGRIEAALSATLAAEPIERRLAERGIKPQLGESRRRWLEGLAARGLVSEAEAEVLLQAQQQIHDAIAVDAFPATLGNANPIEVDSHEQAA